MATESLQFLSLYVKQSQWTWRILANIISFSLLHVLFSHFMQTMAKKQLSRAIHWNHSLHIQLRSQWVRMSLELTSWCILLSSSSSFFLLHAFPPSRCCRINYFLMARAPESCKSKQNICSVPTAPILVKRFVSLVLSSLILFSLPLSTTITLSLFTFPFHHLSLHLSFTTLLYRIDFDFRVSHTWYLSPSSNLKMSIWVCS